MSLAPRTAFFASCAVPYCGHGPHSGAVSFAMLRRRYAPVFTEPEVEMLTKKLQAEIGLTLALQ